MDLNIFPISISRIIMIIILNLIITVSWLANICCWCWHESNQTKRKNLMVKIMLLLCYYFLYFLIYIDKLFISTPTFNFQLTDGVLIMRY
ncbi:hypothetical protein C2G38_2121518 [Gigaspora rosea]|uniref:Uncharacterized protein n=1 Tax=Gigaspora rosea TaxID=44941 RepID=A0A397U9T8_9GLOM|nr:hypothetical protein C2G38_2121518 [Gigaspora rosea]